MVLIRHRLIITLIRIEVGDPLDRLAESLCDLPRSIPERLSPTCKESMVI